MSKIEDNEIYEIYERVVKMELNESMLLKKEDVYDVSIDSHIRYGDASYINPYRRGILPFIPEFKKLIETDGGETIVKIRDIREILGWERFRKAGDSLIYMRMKDILLEFGIKVKLKHHYGANLILSLVSDESEIVREVDTARMRNDRAAKNAGYPNWRTYCKHKPFYRKIRPIDMDSKKSKFYFVNIGKRFVSKVLFPDSMISEKSRGNRYMDGEGYDWITSDGLKVKHMASTLIHRVDSDGLERDVFHWGIGNNNVADIFLLTGWGDRENADLMKAWIISKGEVVNRRPFWDRTSFAISTHDRSIDKYCKYEVDDSILEEIREDIEAENNLIVSYEDYTVAIRKWYSDIFRTITWIENEIDNEKIIYVE